jgi:23S rRNA U2552 (ribose-2'-O)-methylase RlmE/FtsJ
MNNPKKTSLWNVMKNISSTYYYLDKFERTKDNKFIENSDELTYIGKEIFNNFEFRHSINSNNNLFFIDICGAPGMYSKILVEDKGGHGIGISLPPEKGGVEFTFKNDKYKIYYKDILEKKYKVEINNKELDLGLASCVSYIEDSKNAHTLNMELILTSMNIILDTLKKDGDMIINMSMKNIFTCFNIIELLLKQFNNIKLWKSENVWATKNTFYIFCYGYNNNKIDMSTYIQELKNETSDFNTKYVGNNFKKIVTMMNKIYMIRINAWLKLLNNEDKKI